MRPDYFNSVGCVLLELFLRTEATDSVLPFHRVSVSETDDDAAFIEVGSVPFAKVSSQGSLWIMFARGIPGSPDEALHSR
jgi:hypothetical protein